MRWMNSKTKFMKSATFSWIITSLYLLIGMFREFLIEGGLGILGILLLTSFGTFLVALLYFSLEKDEQSSDDIGYSLLSSLTMHSPIEDGYYQANHRNPGGSNSNQRNIICSGC